MSVCVWEGREEGERERKPYWQYGHIIKLTIIISSASNSIGALLLLVANQSLCTSLQVI